MKKVLNAICVLTAMFLVVGCATPYDVELNKDFMAQQSEHDEYQYNAMSDMADSISRLKVVAEDDADPRDRAMAAMANLMMAREIREIKYYYSKTKAPRLNTDNVEPLTNATVKLAPFVTIERVVDKTAGEIGDENYSSEGGDISVEKTEVHTTTVGDSNNLSSAYTKDTSEVTEAAPDVVEAVEE